MIVVVIVNKTREKGNEEKIKKNFSKKEAIKHK